MMNRVAAFFLILLLALPIAAQAEDENGFTFLLFCNEGMLNSGGNVGNTIMLMSVNPEKGTMQQASFLWDTLIEYPGYELPQLMDHPFRVGGPEEAMRVFNQAFDLQIDGYMSINFLNLASLIDYYGGITLDISHGERNALNGLVASKSETAKAELLNLGLDETLFNAVFGRYYLQEYGPDTKLSGIQAVGYGWLQYDSIENCCIREAKVIAQLFFQMRAYVEARTMFFAGDDSAGETGGKRVIDIENLSEEDEQFVVELLMPMFDHADHNLDDGKIRDIIRVILMSAYRAEQQDESVFNAVEYRIFPLEYAEPRITVGGVKGVPIDAEANSEALKQFLSGYGTSEDTFEGVTGADHSE